jgi:phage terminase large subunit
MKAESLVIADQHAAVNTFPGLVHHKKGRMFMRNLPVEFRGSWVEQNNSNFMRLTFPETGSLISGESGDSIGRGDRTSLYFVDESAQIERPELVESSLSNTQKC